MQEGTFGRVYKGTLELAGREQEVIIKTVTGEILIKKKYRYRVNGAQLYPVQYIKLRLLRLLRFFFGAL